MYIYLVIICRTYTGARDNDCMAGGQVHSRAKVQWRAAAGAVLADGGESGSDGEAAAGAAGVALSDGKVRATRCWSELEPRVAKAPRCSRTPVCPIEGRTDPIAAAV